MTDKPNPKIGKHLSTPIINHILLQVPNKQGPEPSFFSIERNSKNMGRHEGNSEQSLLSTLELLINEKRVSNLVSLRRKCYPQIQMNNRRCRSVVTKRRARARNPRGSTQEKVRTLKKLVPNSESMGVERLFEETADYILELQTRVKVMQMLVGVLSADSNHNQ